MNQKIALCQLLPEAGNPEINFSVIEKTVKKCSREGVRLCIFPEDFLYGVIRGGNELFNAASAYSGWEKRLQELARSAKIDLVPGSFPTFKNGSVFNSTIYINSKGQILNKYSKTNLWLSERKEYTSSVVFPKVFNSVLGKTVVIICWDIFDHRLFEVAVKGGAKWVIIIAFWSINQSDDAAFERGIVTNKYPGFSDTKIIDTLVQSRVLEYNIGILFCNFAQTHIYTGNNGKKQKAISANRTQVALPFGVTKKITNRKEGVFYFDIPQINQQIQDYEISYARREDILNNYPNIPIK